MGVAGWLYPSESSHSDADLLACRSCKGPNRPAVTGTAAEIGLRGAHVFLGLHQPELVGGGDLLFLICFTEPVGGFGERFNLGCLCFWGPLGGRAGRRAPFSLLTSEEQGLCTATSSVQCDHI